MNEKLEKQIDKVSSSRNGFFRNKNWCSDSICDCDERVRINSNRKMEKIDDFEENFWLA